MNFITRWLRQCSDCFTHINKTTTKDNCDYYLNIHDLAKHCLHISNRNDFICYKCFLNFFGYDRFIIRQLFFYLNQKQTDYIHIKQLHLFAQRIINWHEFINHTDFIIQLFHILLLTNDFSSLTNIVSLKIDSLLFYELIKDAFFFTAIQTNVQTSLTNENIFEKFFSYLYELNPNETSENYIKLIKRILPWMFIGIHKWLKNCFISPAFKIRLRSIVSYEFNSDLPLTFLWYITNWLVSNKTFPNEYDPVIIMEKVSSQELFTNIYDSDKHGYSTVILCECTYHIDGPFLLMFYCSDERIFAILLEGKLMDSAKPYGGRSSLCLQLSPEFLILERGPSLLYWNIKNRSDGPLAIRIGHNGITRVSLDLNLELIHHPHGTSTINCIKIYKFGLYKTPLTSSLILRKSLTNKQHNEYNLFSVDAHKLAESIGVHLFT